MVRADIGRVIGSGARAEPGRRRVRQIMRTSRPFRRTQSRFCFTRRLPRQRGLLVHI